MMISEWKGLSPFPSHGYTEYETPPKQYENGPMTYFRVITCLSRPQHTLAHPDELHMQKYGKFGQIPVPRTRT